MSSSGSRKASPKSGDFEDALVAYSYRSHIAPRTTTISRRTTGGSARLLSNAVFSSSSGNNLLLSSAIPIKSKNAAVVAISENREKEKKELSQLNDKFASYVERVRFLEVHNKKLQMELDALRGRVGSESVKIREMYEVELKEAKVLIDETGKEKAAAELKARNCEADAEKYKRRYTDVLASRDADKARIDELNRQIAENEAEINLLRRRLGDLEDEAKRYKVEIQRILVEIQRISAELDSETLQRVQLETEKSGLEEELSFLRQMHAQELDELRQKSFVNIGLDSSQFFKSELANAILEIRNEYESINSNQRAEMDQWYRLKMQEVMSRGRPDSAESVLAKEEVRKLRQAVTDLRKEIANFKARNAELEVRINEVQELLNSEQRDGQILIDEKEVELADLRRRLAQLLADYEELTKMKTTLEEEIRTYRRLLEGEGDKDGLKQVVEGIEERARQQTYTAPIGSSSSYSYSIQASSGSGRYTGANAVSSFASSGGSRIAGSAASASSSSIMSSTKLRY